MTGHKLNKDGQPTRRAVLTVRTSDGVLVFAEVLRMREIEPGTYTNLDPVAFDVPGPGVLIFGTRLSR